MELDKFLFAAGKKLKANIEEQLQRIKVGLAGESEQTKEMLETYRRFLDGQANDDEMKKANEQFLSFLKTIGLGVLAVLPLSPITIPAAVKLGKKYGIDILPNSFKKPHSKTGD